MPAYRNLEPTDRAKAGALLLSCLALVRPVGFTEEETRDWLGVALAEVQHLPTDLLEKGCSHAKRTCSHHSRIVPAIFDVAGPEFTDRKGFVSRMTEIEQTQPFERPKYTQAEVDRIVAEKGREMSIARDMGAIVRNPDGTYRPA